MNVAVMMITPEQAQEWLSRFNSANRPVSANRVNKYAEQMKAGVWVVNGESITFGTNGALLNGQHRLLACVKAKASFESMVVKGIADSAFHSIDDGKPRSISDVLAIQGEKSTYALAAALGTLLCYADGLPGRTLNISKYTKLQTSNFLAEHPGIRESIYFATARWAHSEAGRLLPGSLVAALRYLFILRDEEKATSFFESLRSGASLEATSPIFHLRNRLISFASSKHVVARRPTLYALTVTAWNHYISTSAPMKLLRVTGETDLPLISGLPPHMLHGAPQRVFAVSRQSKQNKAA